MKIYESGEMYLEYILILRTSQPSVRAIDIVNLSGYSKPSVSRALSLLKDADMIKIEKNGFIFLTDEGEDIAKKIYERHRFLTQFFEDIGVDRKTAAADACKIEHDMSDTTFEKMKEYFAGIKKEE